MRGASVSLLSNEKKTLKALTLSIIELFYKYSNRHYWYEQIIGANRFFKSSISYLEFDDIHYLLPLLIPCYQFLILVSFPSRNLEILIKLFGFIESFKYKLHWYLGRLSNFDKWIRSDIPPCMTIILSIPVSIIEHNGNQLNTCLNKFFIGS